MRVASEAPDWTFVFKPHPLEDVGIYRGRMHAFGKPPSNLSIVSPGVDAYELMLTASVQIGVCSTTLFEGMALGCRTIILQLPGWEAMTDVIDNGDALLVSDFQDLKGALASAPTAHSPERYYSPPAPDLFQLAS